MSVAEVDLAEIEVKSQAFDYLLTQDEVRERAESALDKAMFAKVSSIPSDHE